jgi:hypothetical protein
MELQSLAIMDELLLLCRYVCFLVSLHRVLSPLFAWTSFGARALLSIDAFA